MEDYAIQKVALGFHISFISATRTNKFNKIAVKAFSVILKAFGLELVTESNEGIRQSTRSFKELTINTDIILDTTLKFCAKSEEKDVLFEEHVNKVDPVLNAVNVKVVNDNLGEKGTLKPQEIKSSKTSRKPDKSSTAVPEGGDETSCSWVPVSYRCNVVKAMDDEGKEGGFIPSIVKTGELLFAIIH